MTTPRPPFKAEIVGSLLRPAAIHQARAQLAEGKTGAGQLREIESRCIEAAVAMQKSVGLKVCSDGEFHRRHWFMDFIERIDGVVISGTMGGKFQNSSGDADWSPPRIEVRGKLGRSRDLSVADFKDLAPMAAKAGLVPKQPIPSPTILHFRGGRAAISKEHYPDIAEFYADLARVYQQELRALYDAGCRYAQIDETNLAFLCDPKIRAQVVALGENPDTLPMTYARLLNDILAAKPADMVVGMHLCRGNHASSWMAEGGYDPVAEVIFGGINVDALFVEYDSPRAGGFAPLKYLGKNRVAVLGLVTTKTPQLESRDELKRRIDEAAKYAPLEQLALSPQCGFASTILGNKLSEDDQKRKLELVVQTAAEVWG
jgi:5-methyltetrahydropteroyltriglutamate--homocysteine methyltransferase